MSSRLTFFCIDLSGWQLPEQSISIFSILLAMARSFQGPIDGARKSFSIWNNLSLENIKPVPGPLSM